MTTPLPCTCRSPICSQPHSQTGQIVMRADFFTYWWALSALMKWDAELQDKSDEEFRQANVFVKRAIADLEMALFGRAEGLVADDYREVLAKLLEAAS